MTACFKNPVGIPCIRHRQRLVCNRPKLVLREQWPHPVSQILRNGRLEFGGRGRRAAPVKLTRFTRNGIRLISAFGLRSNASWMILVSIFVHFRFRAV